MVNLKWKTVLLSSLITALVLFGSWFGYQHLNTEKPIQAWFEDKEGIELVELNATRKGVEITVRFHNPDQFYPLYAKLDGFLQELDLPYVLTISAEQGEFNPFWLKHSAAFAESIYHHRYRDIQHYIEKLKANDEVRDGYVIVAEKGVFIYLDPSTGREVYLHFPAPEQTGGMLDDD
ncbi:hypothetical protein CathTA2_2259 [Caldalkalibacillus thermarum TA2.A1]|uniref:Uncharacterized protein n=1 Tax=Caldalkalibacillus thermarum (strain TA2.A1) TaxID=986075 RepID=F5L8V4_CALTT|nr:hypothetical protein [Caldalkalibacillus thermarum]EGL82236.1 hypothetical protein CathTA2_2259 [Caldalkalibacillus thermarum TA2.A1]QZT32749.1 hypothetical protein HUR95_10170 [Caldalkalibacillus thermarum TA2.A1]